VILERFSMLGIAVVAAGASTVLYTNVAARTVRALPTGLARRVRPALWIAPAALVVSVVLIYPAAATVVLSTFDADGGGFVGLRNYTDLLSKPSTLVALRNSLMWVIGLPLLGAALGLIVAVLTDRVRYGPWVKAALFVPIAVSAVATAVIWRFFYEYKPASTAQTGTLNELVTRLGVGPVPWLIDGWVNNPALIATAVWTQTGLCAVIFAAALRGVSVAPVPAHHAAVDLAHSRRRADHDGGDRTQGVRRHLRHDERQLRHRRVGDLDVQGAVLRS
jgi:alpha-glucoside transport system permease protein